jgi:hypothetical protein
MHLVKLLKPCAVGAEIFGFDFWLALYDFVPNFLGQAKSVLNIISTPRLARCSKLYQTTVLGMYAKYTPVYTIITIELRLACIILK